MDSKGVREVANNFAIIAGSIDSFKVKGGEVTVTLKGYAKPGQLDELVALSAPREEPLVVTIYDPQVRLDLVRGGGGYVYPLAGPAPSRPPADPAPEADGEAAADPLDSLFRGGDPQANVDHDTGEKIEPEGEDNVRQLRGRPAGRRSARG